MAAIRGKPRMPPYLLIGTCWKAEGKRIEEKSGNDSRIGNHLFQTGVMARPGNNRVARTLLSACQFSRYREDSRSQLPSPRFALTPPLSFRAESRNLAFFSTPAKEDGVSLNQWIAATVAQKVGVVETAADFFKKRAGKATGAGLKKFLRTAPKDAPEPEDEML
jgi:hypothetical protein